MGQHHDHGAHDHAPGRAVSAFRWSIALNGGLTALQLVVGFACGSLALIGDALHNLGDVVGLGLGWGADQLSRRPAAGRFTDGYGRSTQMASLLNGLITFGTGVVVVEAIQRLVNPVPLTVGPVAWAAAAALFVGFGLKLLVDAQGMTAHEADDEQQEAQQAIDEAERQRRLGTTICLVTAPGLTFAGLLAGTLAGHALVAWLRVGAGKWIGGRLSERLLYRLSGGLFIAFGLFALQQALTLAG